MIQPCFIDQDGLEDTLKGGGDGTMGERGDGDGGVVGVFREGKERIIPGGVEGIMDGEDQGIGVHGHKVLMGEGGTEFKAMGFEGGGSLVVMMKVRILRGAKEAKICEFYSEGVILGVKEDEIGGLDVPMDTTSAIQLIQTEDDPDHCIPKDGL